MVDNYNPTCAITGKTDKLRMYAIRNNSNNMIGWIFLEENVDSKGLSTEISWKDYTLDPFELERSSEI